MTEGPNPRMRSATIRRASRLSGSVSAINRRRQATGLAGSAPRSRKMGSHLTPRWRSAASGARARALAPGTVASPGPDQAQADAEGGTGDELHGCILASTGQSGSGSGDGVRWGARRARSARSAGPHRGVPGRCGAERRLDPKEPEPAEQALKVGGVRSPGERHKRALAKGVEPTSLVVSGDRFF